MRISILATVLATAATQTSASHSASTSPSTSPSTPTPTPTPTPTATPTPTPQVRPVSEASSLAREAGHGRPAVLHFWATWCDACRDEFPRIRKLLNQLPARNVGVLLVSIDRPHCV